MKSTPVFLILIPVLAMLYFSCDEDGTVPMLTDNFDRQAMLESWVDNLIIPSFENYDAQLDVLVAAKDSFLEQGDEPALDELRTQWLEAYKAWQWVSMYEIGKAEEIGQRNFTNIYPADVNLINNNISEQTYNLELPSNFPAQGFPALDYLLFGINEDKLRITETLKGADHAAYLSDVVNRLQELNEAVLADWKNGYRESFINNSGSSATASTDKMVNDFLFYYEKYFRAGKIGIPAGVFSGTPISGAVEAPYSGIYSRELFCEAFDAIEGFFHGRHFALSTDGPGLDDYLDHIRTKNQTEDLTTAITIQWQMVRATAQDLLPDFGTQIEIDNSQMLQTYDELQKAVVLLKVDMMQHLNIQVDYVDADGD